MSTLLAGCEEERIRSHIVMERYQSDAKQAAMAANEKAQTIETDWYRQVPNHVSSLTKTNPGSVCPKAKLKFPTFMPLAYKRPRIERVY